MYAVTHSICACMSVHVCVCVCFWFSHTLYRRRLAANLENLQLFNFGANYEYQKTQNTKKLLLKTNHLMRCHETLNESM